MTNKEAVQIINLCHILSLSKQLSFGVYRRLVKNAKKSSLIQNSIDEIKDLGKSSGRKEEEINEEIKAYYNEDFKDEFEKVEVSFLDEMKSELVTLEKNGRPIELLGVALELVELGIITGKNDK